MRHVITYFSIPNIITNKTHGNSCVHKNTKEIRKFECTVYIASQPVPYDLTNRRRNSKKCLIVEYIKFNRSRERGYLYR